LGVAAVAGILIVSKLIDIAIKNIPSLSYYFIMGLILGSVYGLWPSQGLGGTPILVIVLAIVVGGALARIFGSSETPQSAPSKAS
jgi:putative membrane protein